MNHLHKNKVALSLGIITGGMHLVWSILVALGWAQPLLDFIFRVHMVKAPYVVEGFSIGNAFLLVLVTAIIGYIVGYLFAFVWNHTQK